MDKGLSVPPFDVGMGELAYERQDREVGQARLIAEKPRLAVQLGVELCDEFCCGGAGDFGVGFGVPDGVFGQVERGFERAVVFLDQGVGVFGHTGQEIFGVRLREGPVHDVEGFVDYLV